jgi:hypothetical protein
MAGLAGLAAIRTHLATRAGLVLVVLVVPADRVTTQAVLAVLVDLVDRVTTQAVLVVPADRVTTQAVLVGLVVRVTTQAGLAAPADQVTIQAGLAAPGDQVTTRVAPAVPVNAVVPIPTLADPGTVTSSVATSMALRGATDRLRGGLVSHLDRTGTGRFLRPAGCGETARSTTGVTRKPRYGIPGSTHGASGSSESGSRCKEQ